MSRANVYRESPGDRIHFKLWQPADLPTVLTHALADEPEFLYMIPDAASREHFLHAFFQAAVVSSRIHGEIYTADTGSGGGLWIGPGSRYTRAQTTRSAFARTARHWDWALLRRCMNLEYHLDKVRRQLIEVPHWYLLALGVERSERDDKIAEALIAPLLARADSYGLPCYLETFNEKHLAFYKTCGFRIAGSGSAPKGGPDFWAMIRPNSGRRKV